MTQLLCYVETRTFAVYWARGEFSSCVSDYLQFNLFTEYLMLRDDKKDMQSVNKTNNTAPGTPVILSSSPFGDSCLT